MVFLVQTVKIFVSFRYEILLEDELINSSINLNIKGLYVPELLMPQTGPARGRRDYIGLEGNYHLVVTKQDKTVNEFSLEVLPMKIYIKDKPKNPFILVSSEPLDLI